MIRKSALLFLLLTLFFAQAQAAEPRVRPADWSAPILSEHLDNWYRVDHLLYRSAQPDAEGMADLQRMGIKRVLNLRQYHSDDDEAKGTALVLSRVPMNAGTITEDEVVAALKFIRSSGDPVLVHCWHGSDRTGTVVALYRIVFQGWSREAALDELVNGGYGYHSLYRNIPDFIQNADIDAIRRRVAASEPR